MNEDTWRSTVHGIITVLQYCTINLRVTLSFSDFTLDCITHTKARGLKNCR